MRLKLVGAGGNAMVAELALAVELGPTNDSNATGDSG